MHVTVASINFGWGINFDNFFLSYFDALRFYQTMQKCIFSSIPKQNYVVDIFVKILIVLFIINDFISFARCCCHKKWIERDLTRHQFDIAFKMPPDLLKNSTTNDWHASQRARETSEIILMLFQFLAVTRNHCVSSDLATFSSTFI